MPRPVPKLSNCYVPLPLPQTLTAEADLVASRGEGDEARQTHSLRQLCIETDVTGAAGSSLLELGHTKVLCEVNITTSDFPSTTSINMEQGTILCKVQFASHIGVDSVTQRSQAVVPLESTVSSGKLNSETMTKEADLSYQLSSAISPAIPLEKFPKCVIVIKATILQDDGSSLSACIVAASMALMDASVEIFDVVTSSTVAIFLNQSGDAVYLADPSQVEESHAHASICIAMLPNRKEVTLWNQSGKLSSEMFNEGMKLCRDGCRTFHKFMREHWVSSSSST